MIVIVMMTMLVRARVMMTMVMMVEMTHPEDLMLAKMFAL
jgi:hypothetical protein